MALDAINFLLEYWVNSHWIIALLISILVNAAVYLVTAGILERAISYAVEVKQLATYVDSRPLTKSQKRREIKFGFISCVIFAIGSLLSRELFHSLWPQNLLDWVVQILCFSAFYETYSYFVHRLLHCDFFRPYHGVHHQSLRCTVWSAYSVHPVEAAFIGLSAPIFMLLFPMSLGVALILHVFGMIFTIFLHSNFRLASDAKWVQLISSYPVNHSTHHQVAVVNFGFVNQLWDKLFNTCAKK